MKHLGRLAGKIAIVTGAGNGIGQGCALFFAREGAHVMACDISADALAVTAATAHAEGLLFTALPAVDLTTEAGAAAVVDATVAQHGRIDLLVNAAAFCVFKFIPHMTFQDWRRTMAGELDLVFLLCMAAWPHLIKAGGGSIVNFSSVSAYEAHPTEGSLAHCAGKGGVLAMTRQLALEGGPHNIRANSIAPGIIATAATREVLSDPTIHAVMSETPMIKRIGRPEDIAACACFLCSDEAGWITGADFSVDGGARANG